MNIFFAQKKISNWPGKRLVKETGQKCMDIIFNWSLNCSIEYVLIVFQKFYNSSCISYSILTAGMVHYSELGIFIIIHTALFEKKRAFKRTLKGFKLHQAKNTLLACPSNWSSYEKVYFQEELGRQYKKKRTPEFFNSITKRKPCTSQNGFLSIKIT